MPSPIAHSTTGYAIAAFLRTVTRGRLSVSPGYAILIANAPDLDFVLQILTGERYHRTFTHSLTLAIAIAASFAYVTRKDAFKSIFWLTLTIYGSHLGLDMLSQGGQGIQLFWPWLTTDIISPIAVFPSVRHGLGLWSATHLIFISFETLYSLLLLKLLRRWQAAQQPLKRSSKGNQKNKITPHRKHM
ncbi:metal-dependent hydrolase [Romeria aff. gracilis LEGE 07310]|uniref:Metal-dependent hydrolase n=1 Tax=Vasconcelosia minhoensis LEGE 07310 TaxID=915328 RepID=A0A8J7AG15_9CYAN|nr:metal-dependent hydrolase [Romeria gracilis]MBE9076843.1 metal-dependent hydrolase [Romeria aff. gracilis LEGE 07310]